MTTSIRQDRSGVNDVDHNMMGIESKKLYEFLRKVVEDQDLKILEQSDARLVTKDLILHMTTAIPERIFSVQQETLIELKKQLSRLAAHLVSNFSEHGQYPFTMRRICELCYDPLKYYKVTEPSKFVSAMNSCCMVSSPWGSYTNKQEEKDINRVESNNLNGLDQEDVSLTKIPWVDESTEDSLAPLITQIDSIMSVNFGFDEDDEVVDDDIEFGSGSHRDDHFDMEEYGGSMLDDDEEDEDYVENLNLDGGEKEEEEEEEEEEEDEEDEEEEEEVEEDEEDKEEDRVRHEETFSTDKRTPSKRSTTELDNYEYEETGFPDDRTPPKKYRQNVDDHTDDHQGVHESPDISCIPLKNGETPKYSQEVVSPENNVNDIENNGSNEDKRPNTIDSGYDKDISSPLSNKTRLS